MKIVCYKDTLLKALNSVIKGVASKTTNPILEGILIQTNENQVKLTTYDMELGIEYIIDSEVKEQGSTVVNAIMFSEIIRKLPDSEIYITLNSNNLLEIECEGALYKLTTMNPDEFPELPKIEIENYLGGYYYFTIDDVLDKNNILYLIESKHSKNSIFPSNDDIKDGLLKLMLYNNLCEIRDLKTKRDFKIVLRLTSNTLKSNVDLPNNNLESFIKSNKLNKKQIEIIIKINKKKKKYKKKKKKKKKKKAEKVER